MTGGRADLVAQVRSACIGLPEVTERASHGAPSFFVRDKRSFATVWADGHHDETFAQLWCAAPAGAQALLIADDPDRFFRPPYVGHRGWVGMRLDGAVDWEEVREVCEDAYRAVAPAALVAALDAR